MKQSQLLFLLIISIILSLPGCKDSTIHSASEYAVYINAEANGLISSKKVNGFTISVKYLPTAYLILKEFESVSSPIGNIYDSLSGIYNQGEYFLLTIAPDSSKRKGDLMFQDIYTYEEYEARLINLSFNLKENIRMQCGGEVIKPAITNMENSYGLVPERTFMIVFPNDKNILGQCEDKVEFVFEDREFDLGINYFSFSPSKLNNQPVINPLQL